MPRPDGKPTIAEIIGEVENLDADGNVLPAEVTRNRSDKPWPPEEDCPSCPGRIGGVHKLSCASRGRVVLPARLAGDRFEVALPEAEDT